MSKPRMIWWSYVRAMVRQYPKRKGSAKTATEQRERDAVSRAIEEFLNAPDKLQLIKLVYWDRTLTLDGAAKACFISYATARRWNSEFLYTVAKHYGLTS